MDDIIKNQAYLSLQTALDELSKKDKEINTPDEYYELLYDVLEHKQVIYSIKNFNDYKGCYKVSISFLKLFLNFSIVFFIYCLIIFFTPIASSNIIAQLPSLITIFIFINRLDFIVLINNSFKRLKIFFKMKDIESISKKNEELKQIDYVLKNNEDIDNGLNNLFNEIISLRTKKKDEREQLVSNIMEYRSSLNNYTNLLIEDTLKEEGIDASIITESHYKGISKKLSKYTENKDR